MLWLWLLVVGGSSGVVVVWCGVVQNPGLPHSTLPPQGGTALIFSHAGSLPDKCCTYREPHRSSFTQLPPDWCYILVALSTSVHLVVTPRYPG